MQVLVVAPLQEEFDLLIDALSDDGCNVEDFRFGSIECSRARDLKAMIAIGGTGKAQFAAQTQYLISHHPGIDLVVCVGAAGALVDHLAVGDIVVSTGTIEHDYKNFFDQQPLPVHAGHTESIERLRELSGTMAFPFGVHFGGIASGDEDIVDRKRAVELHAETDALSQAASGFHTTSWGTGVFSFSSTPFVHSMSWRSTNGSRRSPNLSHDRISALERNGRCLGI